MLQVSNNNWSGDPRQDLSALVAFLGPQPHPVGWPLLRDIEDEPDQRSGQGSDQRRLKKARITTRGDRASQPCQKTSGQEANRNTIP